MVKVTQRLCFFIHEWVQLLFWQGDYGTKGLQRVPAATYVGLIGIAGSASVKKRKVVIKALVSASAILFS
jgi:hypothetical protein